jgi:hypothetical protein
MEVDLVVVLTSPPIEPKIIFSSRIFYGATNGFGEIKGTPLVPAFFGGVVD